MATFNKFNQFVEDLAHQVHDLSSDALTVFLCAAASAPVATNSVLADLTEISYTNASSRVLTVSASAQTSGTYKLTITDWVLTAGGGAIAAFRYPGIYNDTPTSPANPLVLFYDRGSDLTLADTETLTIDFDGTNGVATIA